MSPAREQTLNARLSEGLTRLGFRKWYERQLLSSHAHMVLALLSFVAMLASLEAFATGDGGSKLLNAAFALIGGATAIWAMRRYLSLMVRAEAIAHQANCSACGEYGRFLVLSEDRPAHLTLVRCRRCDHHWAIADA